MTDIDTLLSQMRDLPLDPRLASIDSAVFEGIARSAQPRVSTGAMALVVALSLGIGVAGSLVPAEPARAASVFPLGAPAALAPSTLLGSN